MNNVKKVTAVVKRVAWQKFAGCWNTIFKKRQLTAREVFLVANLWESVHRISPYLFIPVSDQNDFLWSSFFRPKTVNIHICNSPIAHHDFASFESPIRHHDTGVVHVLVRLGSLSSELYTIQTCSVKYLHSLYHTQFTFCKVFGCVKLLYILCKITTFCV